MRFREIKPFAHHSPLGTGAVRLVLIDKFSGSVVPQKLPTGSPMGGEVRGPFSKPFRGWQEAGQEASESFQPPYLPVPPLGSLYELSAGQQFQVLAANGDVNPVLPFWRLLWFIRGRTGSLTQQNTANSD